MVECENMDNKPSLDYSQYKFAKVEKEDKIALITLNRPEFLNAFTIEEIIDVFVDISADAEVNVAVLTGAGRAFSAGASVKGKTAVLTPADRVAEYRKGLHEALINNMIGLRQPLIAAVNGPAVGLGLLLALCSDIIFASEKARFGDGHIKLGLVPGDGGFVMWSLLCGITRAKEFLWTSDIIDANEAYRIGLVNHVVPHDELMPKVMEFARRLAKGPSTAIEFSKRAFNKRLRDELNSVFDYSLALQELSRFTDDHKEGPRAFLEKREPRFTGR